MLPSYTESYRRKNCVKKKSNTRNLWFFLKKFYFRNGGGRNEKISLRNEMGGGREGTRKFIYETVRKQINSLLKASFRPSTGFFSYSKYNCNLTQHLS